ncbi:MAG TPA: BadF/BadG/BcrA/BcrD ATPase family protein [Pseudolysinimonas sp.]|nr:BadF/BadG/BcrA/BcrD ATPase family protein [Pseudolysinimonas sp.]
MSAPAPAPDRTIVAIDGGNSKTDVVLLRGDGTVLARARSGPFTPHLVGPAVAVESFAAAIAGVLSATGLPHADHIAAYLANADLPVEEEAIRDEMLTRAWAPSVVVANDTLALLRAGTLSPDAVAVVCGAGINCVGVASGGAQIRYPALGRTTGDWGGGLSLAKEVLWAAARDEDGRGEPTALTAAAAAHFGLPTAIAVAEALHLHTLGPERIHELVPVLFDTAEAGDPIARALVLRQASEVVLLATVTLRRLGLLDSPADIVLGGGILTSDRPLMRDAVLAGLARDAPRGRPVFLAERPVVGAALLGVEHVWSGGAGVHAALERVRAQIGDAHG